MISAGFSGSYSIARLRLVHVAEAAAAHGMYGIVTGVALPTSNRNVEIEGIDVHSEATPAGPFRRDQSRSASQKGTWRLAPVMAGRHVSSKHVIF
jgi:hypothetical protein